MHDNARGGDDTLTGGNSRTNNLIHGDAGSMDGDSRGGNDTLIGGGTIGDRFFLNNQLFGDAETHA